MEVTKGIEGAVKGGEKARGGGGGRNSAQVEKRRAQRQR